MPSGNAKSSSDCSLNIFRVLNHQLGAWTIKRTLVHHFREHYILPLPQSTWPMLQSLHVHTSLNYFASTSNGEPPYNFTYSPPPDGLPQTNVLTETIDTVVHDVRGKEDTVSLETTASSSCNTSAKRSCLSTKGLYEPNIIRKLKKFSRNIPARREF